MHSSTNLFTSLTYTYSEEDTRDEPPAKKFSRLEEDELEVHFNLRTREDTPTKSEVENFLETCKHCKSRTVKSLTNKIYYIVRKK